VSNTVEIVVQGKNEATKIFRQVAGDATSAAQDTEQAWTKAMAGVETSVQRGGLGATEAGGGFNRLKDTAKGAGDEVERMGKHSEDSAERLHRVGEASDEVDTKAMGFRDTVTGVSDTLKGLSDKSLTTEQRLITLGMGIGDLGSAGYNLLVPAFGKAKQVFRDLGDESSALREKLGGMKGGMLAAGAAVAVLSGALLLTGELTEHKVSKPVDVLTASLSSFSQTGKTSGASAELLGGNLDKLKTAFENTHLNGVEKMGAGLAELIPAVKNMDDSVTSSKERISNLDQALAQLAQQSPEQASAAFSKLTSDMGLSYQQIGQLKDQLPGFANAMQQSANAADGSAQSQERNATALANYLTQLQAATDPVFGLMNALNQVTTAQTGYNDAVKQHGINSNEAKDASVALAQAVAGAEAAALNGQLSYSDFSAALDHWTQSGAITAQQASDIRTRVDQARGAAQAYTGNYDASLFMQNHASGVIAQVKRDLDSVPDSTYKKFYMTYINQVIGNAPDPSPAGFGFVGHRAAGGPIGTAATGGGRSGRVWVGEQGPELVNLPTGSMVNPAGASSSGGGGAAPAVRVSIDLSGGGDQLMEWFKSRIRIDGGNVQTVMGVN
jgi:hypothetical protein